MYQGVCQELFLFRPPLEQLPSEVTVKQLRLYEGAEGPGSLLSCAAVLLHDPAKVSCLFSWLESRDTDFLDLDISLGHGHVGINFRSFTAVMEITGVREATRKEQPAFSKEHRVGTEWQTEK